jgi:hypothetical protein
MNRRGFLRALAQATVGAAVVYSFPSIIVPQNLALIEHINLTTSAEIWPKLIDDLFFQETPFLARMRMRISDSPEFGFGFHGFIGDKNSGLYVPQADITFKGLEDPAGA